MKWIARSKPDQNRAAVDPWTAVHLAAGLAAGLMDVRFRTAMAGSLLYELAEQWFEREQWGQELFEASGPESLPNAVLDSAAFAAGVWLGRRWNASGPSRRG